VSGSISRQAYEELENQLGREISEGAPMPGHDKAVRTFSELRDSGLLWLINRVVFHPRGWALALAYRDGEVVGWKLLGDGSEPWRFGDPEDENFAAAEATLRRDQVVPT
jgi:hypothetical protein